MRYYNENPQVLHWMEKCATLQQELDILNEERASLMFLKNEYRNLRKYMEGKFNHFNSLPWYKKMFYKFNV